MMTRREFARNAAFAGFAAATLSTGGLSLSGCNVFTDIENWVPVGEDALNSIIAVLAANGITIPGGVQTIENDITAAFTTLEAAVKEYQSTTPPPVGALAKIQAAFQTIVDNFGAFFKTLNLPGGTLFNLVLSLAKIVLDTIAGFENRLPTGHVLLTAVFKGGSVMVPIKPTQRSRRVFKKDWNSELKGPGAVGVVVPKNAFLKVTFFEHF